MKTGDLIIKMYNLGRAYERLDNAWRDATDMSMPPQNGAWKLHVAELGHIRDLLEIIIEDDE